MQPFDVVDDLKPDAPAPAPEEGRQASFAANPDLTVAEASLRQADFRHNRCARRLLSVVHDRLLLRNQLQYPGIA